MYLPLWSVLHDKVETESHGILVLPLATSWSMIPLIPMWFGCERSDMDIRIWDDHCVAEL